MTVYLFSKLTSTMAENPDGTLDVKRSHAGQLESVELNTSLLVETHRQMTGTGGSAKPCGGTWGNIREMG